MSPPPLPLTPFERYMVADDQPAFPMVAIVELTFGGGLRRDLLAESLGPALLRHPLLWARVSGSGQGATWEWPASTPNVDDVLCEHEEGHACHHGPISIHQSDGLKLCIQSTAEGPRLTAYFHHAVADGAGMLQFFADWLGTYEHRYRGSSGEPPLPRLASEGLANRGSPRWIVAEPITRFQAWRNSCVEGARWLLRRPQVIRATPSEKRKTSYPELRSDTFTVEETQRLRSLAREHKATLNDLLLRDLFLVLAHWQQNGRTSASRKWLRINMPQNLRLPTEPALPACNVIGYAFLTRRECDCHDQEQLLTGISQETTAIRRWNLGQLFLDGLARGERIPGLVRWLTANRGCLATTVLSNLGDVSPFFRGILPLRGRWHHAGDAPLLRVRAAPPVRPGTHAVFVATTCSDELTISIRSHAPSIAPEEEQELLSRFTRQIRQSIGQATKS